MKIIIVESVRGYNKKPSDTLDIIKDCPRLWMKADSALLKNNKPFFIPDFTRECSASAYLALRICRMGKCITARFAPRYYDAYGIVVDFTAEDVLRQLREAGEPWEVAKSFDCSAACGDFVEIGEDDDLKMMKVSLEINGKEETSTIIDNVRSFANDAIESVSRFFTIRQGDLLLIGCPKMKPLVNIDDHIIGWLNGQKLIEFNVK